MTDRAVTMKDIAARLGVSVNTVHKAVAGKPGVSDATRARILAYAAECGYRRNMEASALRRKNIVISACLPALTTSTRFFYAPLREGCRDYVREYRGQGIRMVEDDYEEGHFDRALQGVLARIEDGGRPDGMVTVPARSAVCRDLLERIAAHGVCLVFASGDEPDVKGRHGAVLADLEVAGSLMAEQAANLLPGGGRILLMAGDAHKDSHYRVARSFHERLGDAPSGIEVQDVYGYHETGRLRADIEHELAGGGVDLACCVFARGSATLHAALRATGRAGKMPAIVSDVFDETVAGMRDGSFTNIIYKDPRRQGYLAMRMAGEYLLTGADQGERIIRSRVSMVFGSTLDYYID